MDGSKAAFAIVIALIAGTGIGHTVGSSGAERTEEVAAAEVAEAEIEAAEMKDTAADRLGQIGDLKRELADAEKKVAEAEKAMEQAGSATGDLQTELEAAYATIAMLNERIASMPRAPKRAICADMPDLGDAEFGFDEPCHDWRFDY